MKCPLTEQQFYRYYSLVAKLCGNDPANVDALILRSLKNRDDAKRGLKRAGVEAPNHTIGDVVAICLLRSFERHGDRPNWRGFKYSQTRQTRNYHHHYCRYNTVTRQWELEKKSVPPAQGAPAVSDDLQAFFRYQALGVTEDRPAETLAVVLRPASGTEDDSIMRLGKGQGEVLAVNVTDDSTPKQVMRSVFWALESRNSRMRARVGIEYQWP